MQPNNAERESFARLLAMAKEEDFGPGDITSDLLPMTAKVHAQFTARQEMVFCGGAFLPDVAAAYGRDIQTRVCVEDGQKVARGTILAAWKGPARQVLPAERVALNFLQRLSGVATLTRRPVDAAAGPAAGIYDTRKTTPGWRRLEKYAVRAGGGRNHRMGLYDAVLVKDNHLAAAIRTAGGDPIGAMRQRIADVRGRLGPDGFIEMEVDTLEQLATALRLDLDVILLDNMTSEQMRRAVAMRNERDPARPALEASGGITLERVGDVAATGVERIAIGAITHSATAVDIGLDAVTGD